MLWFSLVQLSQWNQALSWNLNRKVIATSSLILKSISALILTGRRSLSMEP